MLIIPLITTPRFQCYYISTPIFFSREVTLHGNRTAINTIPKMSTQIGLSKEKKSILEIGLSKGMEGVVHKLVKFHIASSYGLNGLLGVNASRSSHDVVETAGEGRAGNETLASAEVQDLLSDQFTFQLCWQ